MRRRGEEARGGKEARMHSKRNTCVSPGVILLLAPNMFPVKTIDEVSQPNIWNFICYARGCRKGEGCLSILQFQVHLSLKSAPQGCMLKAPWSALSLLWMLQPVTK